MPGHGRQVWRPGHIPSGIDAGYARLQVFIDDHFPGRAFPDAADHVRAGDEAGGDKDGIAGDLLCRIPGLYRDAADLPVTGDYPEVGMFEYRYSGKFADCLCPECRVYVFQECAPGDDGHPAPEP